MNFWKSSRKTVGPGGECYGLVGKIAYELAIMNSRVTHFPTGSPRPLEQYGDLHGYLGFKGEGLICMHIKFA